MSSNEGSEGAPLIASINAMPPSTASSKGAGILGSIVNLTNTIIGAGLLSIPFAFRMSGLILGLMFLVMIWAVSATSFDVLARAAQYTQLFTYKDIALKTYGKSLALTAELFILLYTLLNLVARPIIIAEYLTTVFRIWIEGYSVMTERWFIIILVSLVIFPLTMLRNIDPLKYSSFFSLLCVLFTSVVVIIMFAQSGEVPQKLADAQFWPDSPSALISLGIMVVSFCAHYNAPRMYQELDGRTIPRFRIVIVSSMTICLILYAVVGVTGYLSCLDLTNGNVLDDYSGRNILVTVARLALVIALIFSTPLVLFACRRSFLVVFVPSMAEKAPFWLWILISGSIIIISGIIAYLLPSIDIIFGFSGALIGVAFVFFIPGLFFVLISRRTRERGLSALNDSDFVDPNMEHMTSPKLMLGLGIFLMLFAVLMAVLGTTGSVFRVIMTTDTTHCSNVTDWSHGGPAQSIAIFPQN